MFQRAATIPVDQKRKVLARNLCLPSAELMAKTKKKKGQAKRKSSLPAAFGLLVHCSTRSGSSTTGSSSSTVHYW